MNRNTQIWVGVVVLAGLSGAVYYKSKEDQKIGTSQTTSVELPEIKVPDDVDKIAIQNADKPEIVLEKKGDKWEMTKPVNAPANQAAVKALVDNMKELKTKEAVLGQANDEQKKEYEFTPAKQVHVVASKGGEKKGDITFGKSGGRGQMAMVDGKPGIYAVTGYSSFVYAKEPKGFRDTEIMKFDDANANQVTIEKKDGTLSFTKGGDHWAGTFKDKAITEFDEEKVKEALRTFKNVEAEDFADGKTAAETGLDEPEGKVTVTLKDNAGKYVLKVGKVSGGTSHYAQKDGDPQIYIVRESTSSWALAESSKFQKPKDAGADSGAKPGAPPGMPMGMPGMPPGMPPMHPKK